MKITPKNAPTTISIILSTLLSNAPIRNPAITEEPKLMTDLATFPQFPLQEALLACQ